MCSLLSLGWSRILCGGTAVGEGGAWPGPKHLWPCLCLAAPECLKKTKTLSQRDVPRAKGCAELFLLRNPLCWDAKHFMLCTNLARKNLGKCFLTSSFFPSSLPHSLSNATHAWQGFFFFFIVSFWCLVISEPSPSRNSGGFMILDLELTFPLSLFGMPQVVLHFFSPTYSVLFFFLTLLWKMSGNIVKCL